MFRRGFPPTPPPREDHANQGGSNIPRGRAGTQGQQPRAYMGPSTIPVPPLNQTGTRVVSYDEYFQEVMCFTTGSNPSAQNLIRAQIHALCSGKDKLHTCTVQMPRSNIPETPWSFAFAPSIFESGAWVIVFAAPQDSETVWFFWPEKRKSEDKMITFLSQIRAEGKIRPEENMAVSSKRHKEFHDMVQQAQWQDENAYLLGQGWMT